MTDLIGPRLRARVRTNGAAPLLTYYEPAAGVRVELSGLTFVNWVDKTSNLLVDEELLEPGDVVALELATTAPAHWMTAVWQLACWQVGLVVSVGSDLTPDLVVTGPDGSSVEHPGVDVLACSLHPLGLELHARPTGVRDYAAEVRGQADIFGAAPVPGSAPAWVDRHRHLSQTDLVAGLPGGPQRRLNQPGEPWPTAREGIVTAIATNGSTVAVVGGSETDLIHLIETERVDRDR